MAYKVLDKINANNYFFAKVPSPEVKYLSLTLTIHDNCGQLKAEVIK